MPIVEYTPADFDKLSAAVSRIEGGSALLHRPFVDYYYASRESCRLFLSSSREGVLQGFIGVELMPFQTSLGEITLGFASNYYILQHGAGGFLFRKWMGFSRAGIVFGGSADTHRVIQSQKWTYYSGVRIFSYNHPYPVRPDEPWWRAAAKRVARRVGRGKISRLAQSIPPSVAGTLQVKEEDSYDESLLPRNSPFHFRLAPSIQYLQWRYNTKLSFVRYRVFRILRGAQTAGYVILNDSPRGIMIAQCDGVDPELLAYGVLLTLATASAREDSFRTVTLACSHPTMQRIFRSAGFRPSRGDRPFALGGLQTGMGLPADTSNWLINLDWGDNGLRAPFLDQLARGKDAVEKSP